MKERKSLGSIVKNTVGCSAVAYPIYSGLSTLVDSNATYIDKIKDPETALYVAGLGAGYFVYEGSKELFRRYKR